MTILSSEERLLAYCYDLKGFVVSCFLPSSHNAIPILISAMSTSRRASARRRTSVQQDAAHLAALGHEQELKRNFSFVSMLGLAFAILNSWTALSASLSLALPSGGPTSVIWGLITAGICNLCLAASLAEFLSAFPTSAGQYHWAAIVSTPPWVPIVSWVTGWINTAGWIALTATGGLLGSQLIVGVISLENPNYSPERWHQFLIYVGYTLFAFLINAFLTRALPIVTKTAFIWSITGFAVICITLLACASPNYQSGKFVYTDFINETGWPDGLAWLLGLLQGGLGLTGFDAVAHMIEEIPSPTVEGPRIMVYCVAIGIFTGFVFLSVLLFVLQDVEAVISSTAGPILQIFYDATGNKAGAISSTHLPLTLSVVRHHQYHDDKQSYDLRLCSRWRATLFALLRQSTCEMGLTIERVDFDSGTRHHLRLCLFGV